MMISKLLFVLIFKVLFFQQAAQDASAKKMRASSPSKNASAVEQKSNDIHKDSGLKQARISEKEDTNKVQKVNQSSGLKQANPASKSEKK